MVNEGVEKLSTDPIQGHRCLPLGPDVGDGRERRPGEAGCQPRSHASLLWASQPTTV